MIKKLIITFATLGLILNATGCTSKSVDSEADATAEMAEDGSGEVAEATGEEGGEAVAEGEGSSSFSEDDFGGGDEAVAESAPAEGGDTAATTENAEGFDDAPADGAVAESAPPAEEIPSDSTDSLAAGSTDTSSDTSTDAMGSEVPSNDMAMSDSSSSLGGDEMGGLSEEPPAPKPVVPLKKIQTTPWTQAGILLNAVYVARAGDDFKSVSQKVYGSTDKVSELRKVNPTIAARKMKVGDKVYYNSPKRPADNMQMLTFYEDLGLSPEVYVAQSGENIREVSKKLLGDTNSWKEIWSTNLDVESKGELAEGTRLRYWAGDLVAQAPVEAAPPPMNDMAAAPPPTQEMAPPMPEEAPALPPTTAEVAPPPPPMETAPPPPVVAEAPPAPAEVPPAGDMTGEAADNPLAAILGEGDQTTALMIGAILLIAAVALFIMIRKRKARRNIDFQTATHTQIE